MKKYEIIIGKSYSNGKGRIRKIIGEGIHYDYLEDKDQIEYEIVNDGTKNNRTAGKQYAMTRTAFASWAKHLI